MAGWRLWVLILVALVAQFGFRHWADPLHPAIEEMPPPLQPITVRALAFGDDQFLYRALGHYLEDVGDGDGRVTPLRSLDYDRVVGWLRTLDGLDDRSDYAYGLAAQYFGAISDPEGAPPRITKIVVYLRGAALINPARHWEWLVWCANAASRRLKNRALSLRLAADLAEIHDPDVPAWTKLVAVRLYAFAGEAKAAQAVLDNLSPSERQAIETGRRSFLQRLEKLSPKE